MKLDIPDDYISLIVRSLEHYHAYTKAKQADNHRYQEAADFFKKKTVASEESAEPARQQRKA
jgi:hypothetical protein